MMGLFKIFKRHLEKHRQKKSSAARQVLKQRRADALTKKKQNRTHYDLTSQSASNVDQSAEVSSSSSNSSQVSDNSQESLANSKASASRQSSFQSSVASSARSSQSQSAQSSKAVRSSFSAAQVKSKRSAIIDSKQASRSVSARSIARQKTVANHNSLSKSSHRSEVSHSVEKSAAPAAQKSIQSSQYSSLRPGNADQESEGTSKTYARGLAKSRSTLGQKLNALFANFRSVDDNFFDELEDTLIESDVGFNMAIKISDALRKEVKLKNVKKRKDVQDVIIKKMIDLYDADGKNEDNRIHYAKKGPTVFLFVGVNGAGKTTTIGKMAHMYHQQGKKVLLAAADTFRAGAIEQLNDWARLDQVDIVKKKEHSDPSSVVYDAVHKAKNEHYDILFVDTAGRLQNKANLMRELAKMKKVITRTIPKAPQEVMLVLDATTGQNALSQAKLFKQVTNVTGIILTKLDGTAKGGIILAIRDELHLPVKYVGLGEQVTDLKKFSPSNFVYGLFAGLFK